MKKHIYGPERTGEQDEKPENVAPRHIYSPERPQEQKPDNASRSHSHGPRRIEEESNNPNGQ